MEHEALFEEIAARIHIPVDKRDKRKPKPYHRSRRAKLLENPNYDPADRRPPPTRARR